MEIQPGNPYISSPKKKVVINSTAPISDSKQIIISIAIRYPDWGFAANKLETTRLTLENYVTWCGL